MKPLLLDADAIEAYLAAGHWSRVTMAERCAAFARDFPDKVACRDAEEEITWRRLDALTDRIAANLIARGVRRDACALARMPSSNREMVLRIALKKAGVIGCFVPMQWRHKELDHACRKMAPGAIFLSHASMDGECAAWLEQTPAGRAGSALRVSLSGEAPEGWVDWRDLTRPPLDARAPERIPARRFRFDEVSSITVSSGSGGLPKLCEWPEAAQVCVGRGIAERLGVGADDNVGIFAPMSGAAGLLVWSMSGTTPCAYTFPATYDARALLGLVEEARITVATTVPVILARLAQEDAAAFDLRSLRVLRVGTAAADLGAARRLECSTNCRVVVAAGSMECPGFGHADVREPAALRLGGDCGLPLPGCRLRIEDANGGALPPGKAGQLKVSAPYASSGYWNDPEATRAAWSEGWWATGDFGTLDAEGRLTLLGRVREVINRSGHKILPDEVEREIAKHPDVFQCAVVAAPDAAYGEVPWAFVQTREGKALDAEALAGTLRAGGLATYKLPARFVALRALPRVGGGKIDKKSLLRMARAAQGTRNRGAEREGESG